MASPPDLAEAPGELIDAILAGRRGAGAVAGIATPPLEGAAADLARSVLGAEPADLDLVRTKFKPGRSLTAYYAVRRGPSEPGHAAITWSAQPGAVRVAPSAVSPDGRTVLVAAPDDSLLPGLSRVMDRTSLANKLAGLSPELAAPAEGVVIHTIRYRPGQRHVLRVDVAAARPRRVFVKLDRDDSGARAVRVAAALRAGLAAHRHHVGVVEPVGYLDQEHAAVWHEVPGPALGEVLSSGSAPAPALWRVGAALRALHDAGQSIVDPTWPEHHAAAEVRATVRAGEIVAGLAPELGSRYRALAGQVLARLPPAPEEAVTATHGDVKGDNLVIDHGRVVFLDLDRTARADRALDLGKLLADLRWRASNSATNDEFRIDALAEGYGPTDAACWRRARLLAVVFQLKLAARRTLVHEPDWERRMDAAVTAAEHAFAREVAA